MTIHEELAEARDQLETLTSGPPMMRRNHKDVTQYQIGVAKREIGFHEKVLARSGDGPPT
jgi:phage terminase Nu1 subunit (DNA packaging protein)